MNHPRQTSNGFMVSEIPSFLPSFLPSAFVLFCFKNAPGYPKVYPSYKTVLSFCRAGLSDFVPYAAPPQESGTTCKCVGTRHRTVIYYYHGFCAVLHSESRSDLLQQRGVVWCGVVWCGVVWCGVVWCGVVWYGVVWCGVVWCGVHGQKAQLLTHGFSSAACYVVNPPQRIQCIACST